LSEKYGRKPILSAGLVMYILSSMLCALSGSITELIICRIFQAVGGAAATAVATAVVKDLYDGNKRAQVLAAVMAMVIIAPVLAPLLGAFLLKFTSWRAVFWILAGIGGLALAAGTLLDETLSHRYQGSAFRSLGRLGVVMKNPGFSSLIGIFSLAPVPMMAFIAASSYIYIQKFGLSEQTYSFYFALNAVSAMAGPILYMRISRYFSPQAVISTCFPMLALSGLLVITIGHTAPWIFALTMMPATLSITFMRPPSANLMLEQQQKDTGSASSLINFFGMFMGSMGVFIISLGGNDLVWVLGIMQMTIGLLGGGLWFSVRNKAFIKIPR
jgi:DHA1 family bicyclomycin/chloramphenicol resistance-like MFS transporter